MIEIINRTRPPRPLDIHGPAKQAIMQVRVERNKTGVVGVRQQRVSVPVSITVMPGQAAVVANEWATTPDVIRLTKARDILVRTVEG